MQQQIKRKIFVQDKKMFIEIVNVHVRESIRIRIVDIIEFVFVIIIVDFRVFQEVKHKRFYSIDFSVLFFVVNLAIITERYLCPILTNPPHGRIHYDGHAFYNRLIYECNPGYTVVGPKERICVSDGFWEPVTDVYCIRKGLLTKKKNFRNIFNCFFFRLDEVCTIDHSIVNGHYTPVQQVYYPDQQIRIECTPGYELDRLSPVQICQKNGTWSPVETPRCLSKKETIRKFYFITYEKYIDLESPCGEPPSILNGYLVNTTSSYAQYACIERFMFKDSNSQIECKDGRWQTSRPECIEATCHHPQVYGFNGYVLNSRLNFQTGESTGLICNSTARYDLIPSIDYIVCDNQGSWKPSVPKCYGRFKPRF